MISNLKPTISERHDSQILATPMASKNRLLSVFSGAMLLVTPPLAAAETTPSDILKDMQRVADWQLANPSENDLHDWTHAPFYLGLSELTRVSGENKYQQALDVIGRKLSYGPGPRLTHAEDHAVLQSWLELYKNDKDQTKLAPSITHFDKITHKLSSETAKSVSGGSFTWYWSDALFMSPPVWAHLSKLTDDPKYLEWADKEWWTTTDVLYDPALHLFYRDNNSFNKKTASGKKLFSSPGNGWVMGGLVHMLDQLPENHPSREKYLGLYRDMVYQLLNLQNPDGLWRSSLLDSEGAVGESSGSALFTYAIAWGVNRGLLPEETFRPTLMKGYQALKNNIQPSGMLGFVQKIGDSPGKENITAKSTEVYGSGAFLLAAAEVIRLLDPSKKKNEVASFESVTLPESYLPAIPRTYARFVPERADDFTWENDLIAFRTYGPALRGKAEDSGFDCWFKRVPYPVIDKWYMEDLNKLPSAKTNKSYHQDHGEGLDVYKVGSTRGCGGISAWSDGKIFNSNTYIAHRIIESSPEKTVFELDFASDFKGQTLRETKRITLIMGEHLFQCDSRFTLNGKPAANLEVAIGLAYQADKDLATFSAKPDNMMLWESLDDIGFGTGIVIAPSYVVEMKSKIADQAQALCLARTNDYGGIRWFTGFGWQGQGKINSPDEWAIYLQKFSEKYLETPFEDHTEDSTFKVHNLEIPTGG